MALIALRTFIIGNVEYTPGTALPEADMDAVHVAAMIECGTAEHRDDDDHESVDDSPKAKRVTAKAGMPGIAQPSSGPDADLVGQVPDPAVRGAVKEPAKRPGRKRSG